MTDWIFEALVATTVLMLIILAIRGAVAARFGPRAAYLLWLAPALRMVMPPLPAGWTIAPISQAQDAVIVMVGAQPNSATVLTAPESALSWAVVLGMIWLGGAAVFFCAATYPVSALCPQSALASAANQAIKPHCYRGKPRDHITACAWDYWQDDYRPA